jgi:uncharacterized membrane protein YqaE (UPF0057 family)|tara:strand:+ start:242 stop:481 length:240 start_codon:yes stop_codon:yes gene_type:complete
MAGKESFTNTRLPIIGGITAAIGASLCCVGPFVFLSLGISGAWIGNLSLLEPYRPGIHHACYVVVRLDGLAGSSTGRDL